MSKVYILLGSNLGNREVYLAQAIEKIEENVGELVSKSSLYKTAPWGFESEEYFLNQAICIESGKNYDLIMKALLQIESDLGRTRDLNSDTYTSRNIDIDIVMIDQLIWSSDILTAPHPRMAERRFVLEPLNEIAGNLNHPVYNKTISELLENCSDKEEVFKLEN